MNEAIRYQLWIVAAAGVIFFTHLGATGLWDMDEALYSSCAREMYQNHNWAVPVFNGQMFPEKPPLMFWTMMAGYELFGTSELGARFFSALMGSGTALVAFHLGRLLFNARAGLWAGLITASTIIFTVSARAATVDSALTLVTALAFLFFAKGLANSRRLTAAGGSGSGFRVQGSDVNNCKLQIANCKLQIFNLQFAVPMYACISLAVLGKGPIGMLLPLTAMGLYLLVVHGWRNAFQSAWAMRPLTGLLVIAAVVAPWCFLVQQQTEGRWLREFLIDFNLRPFRQPIQSHGDTSFLQRGVAILVSILYYFYHVLSVLVGFFPWAVFLGPTFAYALRRTKGSELFSSAPTNATRPETIVLTPFSGPFSGRVLALCWFGVWFVFWSICKTKLPHYLLPAYPALALLTACWIEHWLNEPARVRRWELRNAWISTILAGVAIMAIPIVAALVLPGEAMIGLVGLILVAGGGWCWWETAHDRHSRAVAAFAVMSVAFLTATFGFAALRVNRHQNAKPIIAAIQADWAGKGDRSNLPERPSGCFAQIGPVPFSGPPIATYRFFRESIVCYAGYPVTRCDNGESPSRSAQQELAEFVAKSRRSYVITTEEYLPEISKAFAGRFAILFQQRRFLQPEPAEIFVLRFNHDIPAGTQTPPGHDAPATR